MLFTWGNKQASHQKMTVQYWAFISYSHKDAAFAKRMHRRLEGYAFPSSVVGQQTNQGTLKKHLSPIFLDRDEFTAASDLTKEIQAALDASRCLVVVCSPAAAASPWVNREVEYFRSHYPERPILAAILSGEPPACFPDALRLTQDGTLIEPLAADFRKGGDGARFALLKLAAGIAGVRLNSLVQRDAQRRIRRVMGITALSLVAMVTMAVLTTLAIKARAEAEHQRAQAEGLVEFMLTGLRSKLREVGRLDAMSVVNDRVQNYYNSQRLDDLPVDSLERRARLFLAMGEDDVSAGHRAAAKRKFLEASRITGAQLAKAPNDPRRMFAHSQSEFWIGAVAFAEGHHDDAKRHFIAYKSLAIRMRAADPKNLQYLQELSYAETNLCAVLNKKIAEKSAAVEECLAALSHAQEVARHVGYSPAVVEDIATHHAWLAEAYRANKERANERRQRLKQAAILEDLISKDINNKKLRLEWIAAQRIVAWLEYEDGDKAGALNRLQEAIVFCKKLENYDKKNAIWGQQCMSLASDVREIKTPKGGVQ